jgi:hypothetical protein
MQANWNHNIGLVPFCSDVKTNAGRHADQATLAMTETLRTESDGYSRALPHPYKCHLEEALVE